MDRRPHRGRVRISLRSSPAHSDWISKAISTFRPRTPTISGVGRAVHSGNPEGENPELRREDHLPDRLPRLERRMRRRRVVQRERPIDVHA